MLAPEVVLPVMQWGAIIILGGAVIGGAIAGYLDYRKANKANKANRWR